MLERICFVQKKRMAIAFYLLLLGCSLILSCETAEFLDFTPGAEGVCPPRDARCCPDNKNECSTMKCVQRANARCATRMIMGLRRIVVLIRKCAAPLL